jgi:hypothetical protein
MKRRDFIQTIGGAAIAATTAGKSSAAPAAPANLTRGVSLYSYQKAFYTRAFNLEALLAEASSIGARQIQLLPEQMVSGFPNPSDRFVDQWWSWMDKYHLVPDTYCQFQDTVLIKGQDLSIDQGIAMLERDLKLANRMGFTKMRLLIGTPIDVVERAIPLAEKYNVWMGFELHAPASFANKMVSRWVEIAERNKTEHIGIVPDFGIFQFRPNRTQRTKLISSGSVTEKIMNLIEERRHEGATKTAVAEEVAGMNPKPGDTEYVNTVYALTFENPNLIVQHKKYIKNFHAKFWEMTEDYKDYSIAYDKVLPVLIKGDVKASLSSEFEGQRQLDAGDEELEMEQVRRQHVMLRRLLDEI